MTRATPTFEAKDELLLLGVMLAVSLAVAAALLRFAGTDVAGTELALRMTARVSCAWFLAAYVASPLRDLGFARVATWLEARRRAFGVAFGLSMAIHVGFILRLYELHAPERPPMVTDTDFTIGVPGLVFVALMTVTSATALRRRLGPLAWRRLHRTGLHFVWAIFFLCLVDSLGRKEIARPALEYHSFLAALAAALGLRVAAFAARRRAAA